MPRRSEWGQSEREAPACFKSVGPRKKLKKEISIRAQTLESGAVDEACCAAVREAEGLVHAGEELVRNAG